MSKEKLTNEASQLLESIRNFGEITGGLTLYSFFVCLFEKGSNSTVAHKILSRIVISDELESIVSDCAERNSTPEKTGCLCGNYEKVFSDVVEDTIKGSTDDVVSSCDIMLNIMKTDSSIANLFMSHGVTPEQIAEELKAIKDAIKEKDTEKTKETLQKQPPKPKKDKLKKNITSQKTESVTGDTEKNLTNLSTMAENGQIQQYKVNEKVVSELFSVMSKKEMNNAVLVGIDGVGKTTLVRQLANIMASEDCPTLFIGKQLMHMDFNKLITGTMYKGFFEMKMQSIANDAAKKGNYIFFVDDIENILIPGVKLCEMPNDVVLDIVLSNPNIKFICTTTPDGYSKYIEPNPILSKRFTKVKIEEPSDEEILSMIHPIVEDLESFHKVKYTDEAINEAISLSKKNIKSYSLPSSAINTLDMAGADHSSSCKRSGKTISLIDEISAITEEIDRLNNSTDTIDYDKIDELTREELKLKSKLSVSERDDLNRNEEKTITPDDIRSVISRICEIPLKNMDDDDMENLIGINERIKKIVIGQDEAVDTVCKAVKRKKVGISNPDKPSVFLFYGASGVGKTFLAKNIAKEVFGDEKAMVRIDMSEYSDKMSVNKFTGSAPGYVGYEEGGILTEAVKRKPNSVILLDEIEKANEEVFNVLLQVFDEGRLTDNKGILVDFKNTIIVMTSNIGASEIANSGGYMGFTNSGNRDNAEKERKEAIIKSALKHTFKPEFINRIDRMVWFNTLGDNELRQIAINEVSKLSKRIEKIGYMLDNDILEGKFIEKVLETSKNTKDYGARVILRNIDSMLADRLTDLILEKKVKKGETITMSDLCCDCV